ncbi:anti-sigma factor domain-containing protein [Dictyobacter aurantiacus]|uniref:Regulator of SigK n=1 Tax=Dictyobacter aurantiacus TaxID=1936993 RepID=A0A401ZFV5_9CHLR|nr:anti-sigma factor [Dictyobacter aurantiacus]GCE05683.1 hypothetical protein KDAU_30120 [Dictyobacter aurantiacus]
MTCQEFEELSGAYVLGALTPEEKKAMDEHLAQCRDCAAKLPELQAIVNLLPLASQDVEPAADLKQRFFTQLQQEQLSTTGRPSRRAAILPLSTRAAARRSSGRTLRAALVAVAAVLVFSALGGMLFWNLSLQHQIASLSANVVQANTYKLQGTANGASSQGELTCYSRQQVCIVVMHGLPPISGNHVYQGWLLQGKQTTSLGLFTIRDGTATLPFQGSTKGYDAVAISLEPGPTATPQAPKGPVVALGMLQGLASNTAPERAQQSLADLL